ncbi:tRNA synthetases class I (R) [seawater metagenome]|uniref:arginine--tRNA ligase n=1 Tax=seawater metagenome TaxID=1561972 RepID=A0A5E8CM10_9ZZZZ
MNNLDLLNDIFNQSLLGIMQEKFKLETNVISQSTNLKWGDYQSNIAMKLFKKNNSKNPREFSQTIIDNLTLQKINYIQDISIAGPGFINIKLSDTYLEESIDVIIENNKPIISENIVKHKIIVDYSSPNIAKEMHVGHLRSTIIGDVISNIFEYKGNTVERINHIGDWGTQFGMLIAYLKDINCDIKNKNLTISDLHNWYKESKSKFDSDTEFNDRAHKAVVKLQQNDSNYIDIWNTICKISSKSYQEIYQRLNISSKLKICGESFYNDKLNDVIQELTCLNLLQDENGAKLLFPFSNKPPLIIKKTDGGIGYDATDMTALKYRVEELKADKIIYVTDSGQGLHFELLFEGGRKAGWLEETHVEHVSFGVVLGEDGKRIKSRSGDSVKLTDLLDESYKTFLAENRKRKEEDNSCLIEDENMDKIAKIIGWSAVKYADLKQNRINNYIFDYNKMLDTKGDTIVYQLYVWVRIKNIFRKTLIDENILSSHKYKLNNTDKGYKSERELILHITQFDETLLDIEKNLLPNYLCDYMYKLANKFNQFWRDCRVIGSSNEINRLKVCKACQIIMQECFNILSIPANSVNKL